MSVVEKCYKILEHSIESQEIIFKCPENEGKYSVLLKLNQGIRRKIKRKLDFNFPNLIRITMKSFPQFENQNKAIYKTNSGITIKINELSDSDYFLMDIEYTIPEQNFSDFLVQKNVETEAIDKDKNEYWMHAQLKHLSILNTKYGRLDLQDIDLVLDVGVHKDIKRIIPSKLIKSIEITRDWILEKDVEKKAKLSRAHAYSQRTGLKDSEMKLLNQLQDLFSPVVFGKYIDVEKPFHFSDCVRGTDFYNKLPFLTIPKTMKIISRTDLNLENPVVKGKLTYEKSNFMDEMQTIFI